MSELTAVSLKAALWDTLNELKDGKKAPAEGDAIATQAREIIRTVNTQMRICQLSKRQITSELINFSESTGGPTQSEFSSDQMKPFGAIQEVYTMYIIDMAINNWPVILKIIVYVYVAVIVLYFPFAKGDQSWIYTEF